MRVDIRSRSVELSEAVRRLVEHRAHKAFAGCDAPILRILVTVEAIRDRVGATNACVVRVFNRGGKTFAVRDRDPDLRSLVRRALEEAAQHYRQLSLRRARRRRLGIALWVLLVGCAGSSGEHRPDETSAPSVQDPMTPDHRRLVLQSHLSGGEPDSVDVPNPKRRSSRSTREPIPCDTGLPADPKTVCEPPPP